MKTLKLALLLIAAGSAGVCLLPAQEFAPNPTVHSTGHVSPHETFSAVFGGRNGSRVTIVYGRPYSKNPKTGELRTIWGGLVPYDKVWRTGADEATLLITQKPLAFGDTTIPAGAYTLFTLPHADGTAELIVNKQLGQWGLQYDASQDVAHIPLAKATLDTRVDQFTMALAKAKGGGGVLKLSWENTEYSAPFTVVKN